MANEPQFLIEFNNSMNKLQQVKRNIQAGIDFKTNFSNNLKNQLGTINDRMSILAGLIKELKQRADGYEQQINSNTSSIGQKENEVQQLKQQLQDITTQRDELLNQISSLQSIIDQKEQQLRELTEQLRQLNEQKTALENQVQALNNELQNKGDQQSAHAAEIQKLTEETQQQLKQQEEQLNAKINELQAKIEDLERQLREKDLSVNQQHQELAKQKNDVEERIIQLENEINSLKQQNELLTNNLINATQAISEAADLLQNITNNVPNVETQKEVDELIRQIAEQIEGSIENISRATQGQAPRGKGSRQKPSSVNLIDINSQSPVNIQYQDLLNMLKIKANQFPSPNKYSQALSEIYKVNNEADITNILNNNGISIKSGKIMGGKRSKKRHGKQKGGFTYKTNSKRKSITTSSGTQKMHRSSRNSSRRS